MLPRTALRSILFASIGAVCSAQPWPLHLEPMRPFSIANYDQIVFENLIKQPYPMLCMVVKPSFSPEYAICMFRKITSEKDDPEKAPIFLELREATEMIWAFKSTGRNTMKVAPKRNAKCRTYSKQIPTNIAIKIDHAWEKALNNARYCEPYRGTDGVTYIFRAGFAKFGESWCPETGEPKAIADLGEELIKFVKADSSQDVAILALVEKLTNSLFNSPSA